MRRETLVVIALGVVAGACDRSSAKPEVRDLPDAAAPDASVVVARPPADASADVALAPSDADDARAATHASPVPTGPCRAPLAQWCSGPCPTYASALAIAKKEAMSLPCRSGGVTTGDCGRYRFVTRSGGFSGTKQLFEPSGALVGVDEWSDYQAFCGRTSLSIAFGSVPKCTETNVTKTCAKDPPPTKCQCGDPLCQDPNGCTK